MKLLQVHAIAGLNSKTSLSLFTLFTILLVGAAHAEHNGDAGGLRRRPFARIRAWARGMDLEVRTGNMVGACQTTPVAKQELQNQEGMCRIAFFTAAHCVVGDNNQLFSAIRIPGIGEIPSQSIKTEIPREYFNTAQSDPRAPRQGDTATLVFDIPCEKVTDITPVPLAAINNDGTTRIDTAQVYLQKRDSSAPGNRGGGSQIVANHAKSDDPNKFRFDVPSPQGFAIVGGDSGGPIFNAKGELVCPISASSYEYKRSTGQVSRPRLDDNSVLDPFTVVCDNRAIGRLKNQLANYGLAPVSAELLADSPSPSQRPFAASLGDSDFGSHSNAPLTAEEVQRGGWVPDPNGTCDLERGCAFKNPKGEVRFLPNSEKKKLEQAHTSEQPQRTPRPRTAQSSGPQEMNSLNDWNAAFANNADKDGLVMIFSAENCGPCKQLQSQLPGLNKPGVSIFTATRPTYQTTQGHELHERFSKTLGGSVPAAFVYTKNAEGKWEGKVVRGAPNILAAVKGIKSSTNRDVAQTPSQSAPQAQSTPATPATPAPSRQYEFEAGPSNGLFMKTAEAEPESLFLKRQADGTRRAAVKNTDGTHTVLPQDAQTALKNYYESRANDVRRLSAQKQRYIKEFL
ncbi:MAG: hypothetical protein EB120_07030, partial [Proteobacteria bacterium]|nr:hypothetical protein [Pseudomonadota bacterium]